MSFMRPGTPRDAVSSYKPKYTPYEIKVGDQNATIKSSITEPTTAEGYLVFASSLSNQALMLSKGSFIGLKNLPCYMVSYSSIDPIYLYQLAKGLCEAGLKIEPGNASLKLLSDSISTKLKTISPRAGA